MKTPVPTGYVFFILGPQESCRWLQCLHDSDMWYSFCWHNILPTLVWFPILFCPLISLMKKPEKFVKPNSIWMCRSALVLNNFLVQFSKDQMSFLLLWLHTVYLFVISEWCFKQLDFNVLKRRPDPSCSSQVCANASYRSLSTGRCTAKASKHPQITNLS